LKDPEGFVRAMDGVFEKIIDELATLRVYFREDDAVVTSDTHVMGGRLFEPKQLVCPYGTLPDFITHKVALLRLAGRGVPVEGVGVWRKDTGNDQMYYIKATPRQWNAYAKDKV
jgi:hypothetical protein